jgi:hypothetical protein
MKNNTLENLQRSGASSAGISDTRELPQKFITLGEVAYEASRLLSLSAPNIIEAIQVFTDLDVRDLSGNMRQLRKPYYKSPTRYYRVEGKGSKVKTP